MRRIFFRLFPFIFSIVVAFPVILPYFHSGFFPTHDGEWAVVRLGEMFRELRDLQIPPRYSENLNFGYGYPLFNFVYPFPYYLGTFIHFLGFGFVDSIKILFAGSVPLSAFFMFLASRILWRSTLAGLVSAIMYIYFPYRMVDLYVRGSIGESLSFALFPLLFYLAIKLVNKASVLLVFGVGISVGILIMTHNIMTVLFLPIFIIFTIGQVIFNKKKIIKPFIVSIILGLGISAFFWIPAIFEKNNILLSQIPIADRNLYFVKPDQLLFSRWGYGVPTDQNGFSYQFGIPHLLVLFLVAVIVFRSYVKTRHSGPLRQSLSEASLYRISLTSFLLISVILVYIFLLFKQSAFLWKAPFLSEINYPWTALGILGFLVSLLAGFLCRQNLGRYAMVFLGAIAVFTVLPYAKPEYYFNKGDDHYLTNDATTTSSNELMPLWVKQFPSQRPENKVEIVQGVGKIGNVFTNSKQIKFSKSTSTESTVRINTIYYPGWKASIDNQAVAISYQNEKGVMDISIPSGKHMVKASLTETPLRATSNTISLLSFVVVLFLGIKSHRKSSSV